MSLSKWFLTNYPRPNLVPSSKVTHLDQEATSTGGILSASALSTLLLLHIIEMPSNTILYSQFDIVWFWSEFRHCVFWHCTWNIIRWVGLSTNGMNLWHSNYLSSLWKRMLLSQTSPSSKVHQLDFHFCFPRLSLEPTCLTQRWWSKIFELKEQCSLRVMKDV